MAPIDNSNIVPASKFVVVVALVVFALSCTTAQARPSLEMRQRAQVITRCTIPGTVALTFVSTALCPRRWRREVVLNSYFFLGVFIRMMDRTSICELDFLVV